MQEIAKFAHTFDGYAHFGEAWGERVNGYLTAYEDRGELPDDVEDLRACLYLEHRRDRFTWSDFEEVADARSNLAFVATEGENHRRGDVHKRALVRAVRVQLGA